MAATVLAGGAERASCTASHGHEVSAVIPLAGSGAPIATQRCAAAFAGYVGHDEAGSIYVTFPVLPDATDPRPVALCLVARGDGNWMDHPARGSGE